MEWFHAVFLGIVEGVTEFLPISSTGHLMIAGRLLGLQPTEFLKSFEIAIQSGAILAVVLLYWRRLLVDLEVMKRVASAFLPTAVIGFILYRTVKTYLMSSEEVAAWALLIGGVIMIVFDRLFRERDDAVCELSKMPYRTAVLIGAFQALAMIPGVSRSAATILGGMALGLRRKTVVEFSFLLAVPTMAAATGLDILKSSHTFNSKEWGLLALGAAVSFAVALISIRWLLAYIRDHGFTAFGVYRIIAGLGLILFVL
ncbi:MAG: undecaprenyl-diphosphate phosphatase [Candidatus Omnitrophica bacterium]|nr:undecaprenyl-diphosphate phosphatase [Candidatus Omnitrophota bacterium]